MFLFGYRVLICNLYKNCGFGCQIHHLAYCLLVAFGEERMMIMQNDGKRWNYSSVWSSSFAPLSKCSYNETTLVSCSKTPAENLLSGKSWRVLFPRSWCSNFEYKRCRRSWRKVESQYSATMFISDQNICPYLFPSCMQINLKDFIPIHRPTS